MPERKSLDSFKVTPIQKKRKDLSKLVGSDFIELLRGEDAKPPEKGKDYFTEEDKLEFAKIVAELVPKAQNGLDGEDGKDGKDGRDGKDADEEAIISRIIPLIRTPEDGKDADPEAIAKEVYDKLKGEIQNLTPEEVAEFVNKSKVQIKQSSIEGLEDRFKKAKDETDRSIKTNIRFAGGNTSLHIKNAGANVGQVETINFTGATITPVGDGREINVAITGGGGGTWGSITGTLSDQTDLQAALDEKVTSPASSTDNAIARYDLTTGKIIQNSGVTIDDSNNVLTAGNSTAAALIPSGSTIPTNGLYLPGANTISLATNSAARFTISTTSISVGLAMSSSNANSWNLMNGAPSATVPNIIPNRSASTTGFGAQAAGNISAIVSGAEVARFTSTGLNNVDIGATTAGAGTFSALTVGTLTGILKGTSGVVSTATAGADYQAPISVSDTAEIDLTFPANTLSASIVSASIDESKLDASVNASLDLADTALQTVAVDGVTITGDGTPGDPLVAVAGGSGTVTSVSVVTANGISGSVATATTTPAITLTLGAITPTSVNGITLSGSGSLANSGTSSLTGFTGSGTSSGTNTGDQTTITGNAGSATALQTARTIGTITGDATSAGSSFDGTANNTNALTLATVNSNVGSFGSATAASIFTVNAKGLITAASSSTITPAVGSITGLGTGVATALAVNVGSAGAPVLFNGAGGTPSSLTLTNATGLPLSTGVTGDLPFANLTPATAASKLLGRGDSGAGDYQEITIGSGLTMTGTTLSATGSGTGITWSEVTGTSQTAAINSGYITNNAALVTVTLPTTAAVGSIVRIAGKGAGGWKLAQNASEIVHFDGIDTTTGTGGSLASTVRYDAVEVVCIVADTEWVVVSSIGNITIV